jgi:hypothetical protein
MVVTTEQLWETFYSPLKQFIRRRVDDEQNAEDILQRVIVYQPICSVCCPYRQQGPVSVDIVTCC